jgi:alkyl hydroperoxide reductase subunit AhpC
MNKETIEEANWKVLGTKTDTFYNGAKWQQEQDKNKYSEEEVLDIINSFEKLCYTYQSNKDWFPAKKSEWFEKFKKK